MQKQTSLFFTFIFFFILSLILFATHAHLDWLSGLLSPLQARVFAAAGATPLTNKEKQSITTQSQAVQLQQIQNETNALRDQFANSAIPTNTLLPVRIIGMPRFIPGVSTPETLIIDHGSDTGIKKGAAVVVKNILLGEITTVTAHTAIVTLVTNTVISFTAKTQKTEALGIAQGLGGGNILLQNVVLSDSLRKGDSVMTKGSEDANGVGLPPDLLVGTIISVNKNPSALFQTAALRIPINIGKLDIVFVKVK